MLTILMTMAVFAAALLALSLGALLGGKRLRKSCGDLDGAACVCARPCARRAHSDRRGAAAAPPQGRTP